MARPALQAELRKRHPFPHPEEEAYLNLLRTANLLLLQTERLFKQHGLSESTYNILRILRGQEHAARERGDEFDGLACSVIAGQMVTQVPDLTRLLDRLNTAGLVRRARSRDDRRVVRSRITPKGRRLLEKLDGPLAELQRTQLGHMTRKDLRALSGLLVQARAPHAVP